MEETNEENNKKPIDKRRTLIAIFVAVCIVACVVICGIFFGDQDKDGGNDNNKTE